MDTRFTGVIPPVITPFKDGQIDLDSLDPVSYTHLTLPTN